MPSRSRSEQPDEIPTIRETLRLFWRLSLLVRPYWGPIIKGILLGTTIGTVALVSPYLSKLLIDEAYPARDVSLMQVLVAGTVALGVASAAMGAIRSYFTQVISSRLNSAVHLLFLNHLQHLPVRFYDQHRVGEVMSRFSDVRGALGTLSRIIETVLLRGVHFILVPPFLFLLHWQLALLSLVTVPITTLISGLSGRVVRRYSKQSAEAYADLNAYEVEVLSHIRTLKSLASEHRVYAQAREQIGDALQAQLRASGLGTAVGLLNDVIRAAGMGLLTWYGWTLILRGDLTLGGYIAFTAYQGYLTGPVNQIASLFLGLQQAAVTVSRAFEYLDETPEQDPSLAYAPAAPIRHRLTGELRLENVCFQYSSDKQVLTDVNLEIAAGSVVALVGPSGAGKSSLIRLLCRLDVPTSGRIYAGRTPFEQIPIPDLRRQISVVLQEAALVRGTLWENLTLGVDEARREDVEEAIRICRLEEMVAELPEGYETPIADWGASLSGGQRQRVAIARVLLRNTPILLLDEATASIDVTTEMEILRELFTRLRDRTIVFATHRVGTAALADHVVVLEAGRIVDQGAHVELLARCELYRRMHEAGSTVDEMRRLRLVPQRP